MQAIAGSSEKEALNGNYRQLNRLGLGDVFGRNSLKLSGNAHRGGH